MLHRGDRERLNPGDVPGRLQCYSPCMSRRRVFLRVGGAVAGLVLLAGALSLLHPRVQYVLTAARYQLEVLWGRVPVEEALASGQFTPEQQATARLVPASQPSESPQNSLACVSCVCPLRYAEKTKPTE